MSNARPICAATVMTAYRIVLTTALQEDGSRARVTKLSMPTQVPPTIVAFCSDSSERLDDREDVNRAKKSSVGAMKRYDQPCLRAKLRVPGAHETFVPRELLRVGGACELRVSCVIRVGGACGPPPPVVAPLASSLRTPYRGDPPLNHRRSRLPRAKRGHAARAMGSQV